LDGFQIPVSIFNLPLCLLPENLRRFSRHSISDWKRLYPRACGGCSMKASCGGVFGTSKRPFANMRPL
jgi:hypothetical protein